jgi:hypothetical protein
MLDLSKDRATRPRYTPYYSPCNSAGMYNRAVRNTVKERSGDRLRNPQMGVCALRHHGEGAGQ